MEREPVAALREAADPTVTFDGLTASLADGTLQVSIDGAETAIDGTDLDGVPEAFVPYITNWFYWQILAPQRPPAYAFLRWLEGASEDFEPVPERYDALEDGVTRTWGQLRITTTRSEGGHRRYELGHVADETTPLADLDAHDDVADAEEIARFDERGRYRPLKTAPTLPSGWVFPDLGPGDLLTAVSTLYPATVENWHRERAGDLDVTHYREAAERQTGRYQSVADLPVEALEWAVEACCVDSQCLKRRAWDEDSETDLDVPRGDGAFPCREPCSLFVAAATEWTDQEREASRTYTFELTPSEKAQLEAIIDAVADGRTDAIREADLDEGANRYRARYLRAKRFADGQLPTETHDEE